MNTLLDVSMRLKSTRHITPKCVDWQSLTAGSDGNTAGCRYAPYETANQAALQSLLDLVPAELDIADTRQDRGYKHSVQTST